MGRTLAWLGLALAIAVGAYVRWTRPADVQDLRPRPDALEYEEGARNLASGDGYCLVFDGGRYPPRYPPGFSALLVPAMWLTGGEYGAGIWSVLVVALIGIAATWDLARVTGGPASAIAAALLLALSPLHVRWSRTVMADVPTATVTTLLVLAAVRCTLAEARPRAWFGLGVGVGLSAMLRSTCALALVPIAVVAAMPHPPAKDRATRLIAFAAGVAGGVLPAAVYALVRFGSPFGSGYDYWVRARFFGLDYALTAPVANGREGNLFFYLRELAGGGTLYGRAIAIAVASGLAVSLVGTRSTRLLAGLAGGTALLVCASYVPFFWQWDRFLLAALPLLIALAAMLVGTAAPASVQLAGVCLLAYGLASALQPRAFDRPNGASGEVETLRAIAARVEPNAVLIARTDPLLVARIFRADTDRLWLPIDRGEHRNLIRALHLEPYARARDAQAWVRDIIVNPFDPSALEGAVRDLLVSGRPVYFTAMQLREVPFGEAVFAMLRQRFTLRPSVTDPTTGLMQVLPNAMPTRPDG